MQEKRRKINSTKNTYIKNKKSPSPSKEHLSFLPDEGDHIIIFYFSTLIVTPDLNRNSK